MKSLGLVISQRWNEQEHLNEHGLVCDQRLIAGMWAVCKRDACRYTYTYISWRIIIGVTVHLLNTELMSGLIQVDIGPVSVSFWNNVIICCDMKWQYYSPTRPSGTCHILPSNYTKGFQIIAKRCHPYQCHPMPITRSHARITNHHCFLTRAA